jgi:hypothetical protein
MATKLQFSSVVSLLLFGAIFGFGSDLHSAADDPLLSRIVPSFSSTNESAISAILRFGREANIPLGIVLDKQSCSLRFEELRIDHASVRTALDQLTAGLTSYSWSLEYGTVVFAPLDLAVATTRFLSLVVNPYDVPEDTLQAQAGYEWMNIRASLRPNEGTALSILSSAKSRRWSPLSLGSTTVKEVLNRLVGRNPGGAWILFPIEDMEKAAENRPFQLIDYSSPVEPMSPCSNAAFHK